MKILGHWWNNYELIRFFFAYSAKLDFSSIGIPFKNSNLEITQKRNFPRNLFDLVLNLYFDKQGETQRKVASNTPKCKPSEWILDSAHCAENNKMKYLNFNGIICAIQIPKKDTNRNNFHLIKKNKVTPT